MAALCKLGAAGLMTAASISTWVVVDGIPRAAGMAKSNIDIYWNRIEMAPEGVLVQVRVSDGSGDDYLLPYP